MRKRQGQLDLLRFVAALFIVAYHYGSSAPEALTDLVPVLGQGYLATNLFLILSGYVLTAFQGGAIERGLLSAPRFFARRIVRVWPAHFIVLCGFVMLVLVSQLSGIQPPHPERFQWSALPLQVFLLQAWGFDHVGGWNTPSWTLSALVFCYLLLPFMVHLTARTHHARLWLVGTLLVIHICGRISPGLTGYAYYDLPFWWGLFRAVPLFILGISIARVIQQEHTLGGIRSGFWQALGACLLFSLLEWRLGTGMWVLGLNSSIVLLAAGAPSRAGSSEWRRYLGDLSFPMYITHALFGAVWFGLGRILGNHLGRSEQMQWVIWFAAFPGSLLVSVLFMHLIDRPVQKWLQPRAESWVESRWVSRWRAPARERQRQRAARIAQAQGTPPLRQHGHAHQNCPAGS